MKRMAKLEVAIVAQKKAENYICQYGLDNAYKIVYNMYRELKVERKKRKEKTC